MGESDKKKLSLLVSGIVTACQQNYPDPADWESLAAFASDYVDLARMTTAEQRVLCSKWLVASLFDFVPQTKPHKHTLSMTAWLCPLAFLDDYR
jgi:hypothetical protein